MRMTLRAVISAVVLLAGAARGFAQEAAPAAKFQLSAEKLAAYVGQYLYDDDPDIVRSLTVENQKLYTESFRSRRVELVPQSEDRLGLRSVPRKSASSSCAPQTARSAGSIVWRGRERSTRERSATSRCNSTRPFTRGRK